jgi:hypothetical protein
MPSSAAASKVKRARGIRPTPKPRPTKLKSVVSLINDESVLLVRMKGTKGRGGDSGGEAWRIDVDGRRAGVVFVNLVDALSRGKHAAIHIFLNAFSRGRHVGRSAYRKACHASQHNEIFAYMRKSNLPSRRAAEAAGFVDATPPNQKQLTLVWRRNASL